MKYGLDVGIYGRLAMPEVLVPLARSAEESGFDSLWLADHVVFPVEIDSRYPYTMTGRFPGDTTEAVLEPLATMGILVGETKRVRIGTAVLVMPYRNPVVLAKMLATYDLFSGGRIVLGAGVGWLEEEFDALETRAFADRGRVTDEYLELFKRLCGGGRVEYSGEHYQLKAVIANPPSVQQPHIPIVIGGMSNAALGRVARHGNGWLSLAYKREQLPERLAVLATRCARVGRSIEDVDLYHKLFINIGEEQPSIYGGRDPGTGTAAQIADDIKALADLGYRHVIIRYRGNDRSEQLTQLKHFVDEVTTRV